MLLHQRRNGGAGDEFQADSGIKKRLLKAEFSGATIFGCRMLQAGESLAAVFFHAAKGPGGEVTDFIQLHGAGRRDCVTGVFQTVAEQDGHIGADFGNLSSPDIRTAFFA